MRGKATEQTVPIVTKRPLRAVFVHFFPGVVLIRYQVPGIYRDGIGWCISGDVAGVRLGPLHQLAPDHKGRIY